MRYETLYNLTLENGGATIRVEDYPEKIVMPAKGFAVGNNSEALVFTVGPEEATKATFDHFVERVLEQAQKWGDEYFGTWLNDGEIHIEPVDIFSKRDIAVGVALCRGERAIYDLANKREIYIRERKR